MAKPVHARDLADFPHLADHNNMRLLNILILALCVISNQATAATLAANADVFSPFPPGFTTPPDQPDGWVALPPGRPFPSLASDPRDLKIALRKNSKEEIEADVGGYRSFAGWKGDVKGKPTVLHIGIEGNGYFLMRQEDARFPLQSSDGLMGLYGEAIRGLDMFQMRLTHISAHLSDGIYTLRQRIVYTREFLVLRYARQLGWTRPYIGYTFLMNTKPVLPRHSAQLGFYSVFPIHWGKAHPYVGGDLKIKNKQEGTTYNLTAGLALVSSLGAPPLRISFNYLKGHDPRGQYYSEKTEKFSAGLDLDF